MDEKIQTSQQKEGSYSLPEGKQDSGATLTGTDNGGGRGDFTKTSQQIRGEYSDPASK